MLKKIVLLIISGLNLTACTVLIEPSTTATDFALYKTNNVLIDPATNITNFSLYKAKSWVRAYHESGAYLEEVSKIARDAQNYLDQRLREGINKPAIVFDVDETLLSNYEYLDKQVDFAYQKQLNVANEHLRNDLPPLTPVVDLCRYALNHQVSVFIITGRFERRKSATEANLKKIGCEGYRDIYFRETSEEILPAADYKTAERKVITDEGYQILVNIGDQESDLRGGYAEKTFKLPNDMYLIP